MSKHYADLIAWHRATELVQAVYDATDEFPKREIYSLSDQVRRAALSIPGHIAEGQAHFGNRKFLQFLRHSRGSLPELETQVLMAQRRQYLSDARGSGLRKQTHELSRIRSGFINSLKDQERSGS